MAFPKNQRGVDLMFDAPSPIDEQQLVDVGLALRAESRTASDQRARERNPPRGAPCCDRRLVPGNLLAVPDDRALVTFAGQEDDIPWPRALDRHGDRVFAFHDGQEVLTWFSLQPRARPRQFAR